jgi:hypothetical protein
MEWHFLSLSVFSIQKWCYSHRVMYQPHDSFSQHKDMSVSQAGQKKPPTPLEATIACDPSKDNKSPFCEIALSINTKKLSLLLWLFPSEH